MRAIRTELYFTEVEAIGAGVSRIVEQNPGVSFAFFGADHPALPPSAHVLLENVMPITEEGRVRVFLDFAARGVERSFLHSSSRYFDEAPRNGRIVNAILESNIVLEGSPPRWEEFRALMKGSPVIFVGTFIGQGLAGSSPALMILTIPLGIIAVSSAVGIGKAMERGLYKEVSRLFDRVAHRR